MGWPMTDTFDAGIDPGGLRDRNEIKILICYLLKTVDKPLSFDSLNEILQKDGLVNYFEFAQCMHELLLTGHIDLAGQDDYYKCTKLGAGTAAMFERRLPLSVREKSVRSAIRLLARIKREAENRVTVSEKPGGGYDVTCTVLDGGDSLLSVGLLVPGRAQAEAVRRRFLEDPELLYKGVIALLTGDIQTVGGLLQEKDPNEKAP